MSPRKAKPQDNKAEIIIKFSPEEWELICAHGAQGEVLDLAEESGADAVRALLEELAVKPFNPAQRRAYAVGALHN